MRPYIDLDQVDKHGPQTQQARFTLDASEVDRIELKDGVNVDLSSTTRKGSTPTEYLVSGKIAYDGELLCARCLEPFPFAHQNAFELRYRPRPADFGDLPEEIEIADEDLDLDYYDGRKLPLDSIAYEQVQLSLPMKPLCEEACRGLCPQCGSNLRRGECTCSETVVDQRWDSLREFREQLTKKNEN